MAKIELTIAAGLVWDQGLLLITRRKAGSHLGSFWEFPGGKVRVGESLVDAVRRELWEEVGLAVQVGNLFHHETAHYPERTVHLHFFNCKKENAAARAKALEVDDLKWVEVQDLPDYSFPSGNDSLLELLMNNCPGEAQE